jgi:hypothetical protein
MNVLSNWPRNRLLLALPSRNLKRLMPQLEQIPCLRGQVLMDADSSLDHVFFPDSGVVSVVAVYADGSIIEMATIGREGFTGVTAVFGAKSSSFRLLVQIPGSAAKMSRAAFTRAMGSMPSFRSLRCRNPPPSVSRRKQPPLRRRSVIDRTRIERFSRPVETTFLRGATASEPRAHK